MSLGKAKPYRYILSGVEVFSMSFKNKKNANRNNNNNNSNPMMALDKFKGRIFLADNSLFHAIYDAEKEEEYNQLYTELPPKNKRPRVEPTLDLSATNDEEEEEELPVMGPPQGCLMVDDFSVLVHDVTGPNLQFSLDCAPPPVPYLWGDCDMAFWNFCDPSYKCNEPTVIKVDGAFGSVKLHCMMFDDSKVARVQVEWIPKQKSGTGTDDEILICGEITVSCPTFQSCKSFLLKTPTDKTIKASVGLPIPLLKYVVCIPNDSGFIVSADLVTHPANDDDSAGTVSGSVDFSKCLEEETSEFYTGFNSPGFEVRPYNDDDFRYKQRYKAGYYCKSTKFIEGDGPISKCRSMWISTSSCVGFGS